MKIDIKNNQQNQQVPKHIQIVYQYLLIDGKTMQDAISFLSLQKDILRQLNSNDIQNMMSQWAIEDALRFLETYSE